MYTTIAHVVVSRVALFIGMYEEMPAVKLETCIGYLAKQKEHFQVNLISMYLR